MSAHLIYFQFNSLVSLKQSPRLRATPGFFSLSQTSVLFTLMASETHHTVEFVQFLCTEQCLADTSLFQTVRDFVHRWQYVSLSPRTFETVLRTAVSRGKGLNGQYWGATEEKGDNIYWVLCESPRITTDKRPNRSFSLFLSFASLAVPRARGGFCGRSVVPRVRPEAPIAGEDPRA